MRALFLLFILAIITPAPLDAARPVYVVGTRSTIELVGIVFRLAGNPEFSFPAEGSAARTAIDAHFSKFADHPTVQLARRLREERGISYDAPMSLATHLNNTRNFSWVTPLDERPARLDPRWDRASAEEFRNALQSFAAATGFNEWWKTQKATHDALIASMSPTLYADLDIPWFNDRIGLELAGPLRVIVSPVAGESAYAVGIQADEGFQFTPVMGALGDAFTEAERKTFLHTMVHELCHPTVNPAVDATLVSFADAGAVFFPVYEVNMRHQGYGTWQITLREIVVRAYTAQWILEHEGHAAKEQFLADQATRGFELTSYVSRQLGRHLRRRKKVKEPVEAFLKTIVEEIRVLAEQERTLVAPKRPRIVAMTPAPGATGVPSGPIDLQIVFDRPMHDGYSLMKTRGEFPQILDGPHWNADHTVLTTRVFLEEAKAYSIGINAPGLGHFRAKDGPALIARLLEFTTAKPPEVAGGVPSIVSITPTPGATDVPAGRSVIRIEFDRAMEESFSVTGGGESFPQVVGKPRWNTARTVFTLPVEFAAGKSYEFGVNGPNNSGFRASGGEPVEAVWVKLRVKE